MFMDESTLMLRDTGRWVWVRRGNPTPTHEVEGLKFAVHVWGAIWNDGALFQQYRGWLTADRYTEILKHNILANKRRFRGKTILHDGAPSHRAKLTQEWLNENQLAVEFTPPHSPQFNAIEYAWAWLKAQVRDTEPHSDTDLKESMKLAKPEKLPLTHPTAFEVHAVFVEPAAGMQRPVRKWASVMTASAM